MQFAAQLSIVEESPDVYCVLSNLVTNSMVSLPLQDEILTHTYTIYLKDKA